MRGLGEFSKKIKELGKAVGELDGNIASVSFDPDDPASIDQAIREANAAIDAKVASYGQNDMVMGIAEQLKETARSAILEKVALARANRGELDDD